MSYRIRRWILPAAMLCLFRAASGGVPGAEEVIVPAIHADAARKTIRVENGRLALTINLNGGCRLDSIWIGSKSIVGSGQGGYSGIRIGPAWYTTRTLRGDPLVVAGEDSVRISNIRYACGDTAVDESWTFAFEGESLLWTIDRVLPKAMMIDGNAFPALGLGSVRTFDAALLGNGGVAWFRLFNDTALAYGVHTDLLNFWKAGGERCLEIESRARGGSSAVTLSRADTSLTCAFSLSPSELTYRYDSTTHRRRFIRGATDVWRPAVYPAGRYRQVIRIASPSADDELGRGTFRGIDGEAVTSILNTIARLGVIDSRLYGGNSWHTPYGPICLHEQYIAQFNVAIDDANYTSGYAKCLDYYRDHAILPDGRVKPRWAYTDEDAMPGTADSLGFYEAQWGILLDSNPDFVINVADQFDQSGDLAWLRTHKESCEKALDFMLERDTDGDSLAEMMTNSHREKKGSDWLDVIWASWEDALVNAELYHALDRWSDLESVMGDSEMAAAYRGFAAGLKRNFNRSTSEGGFWQDSTGWYVHWREKDSTICGNNLVTPVNFMAIAYGICDDPLRRSLVLDAIQLQMQKERLFFWPVCMFPYEPGVAHANEYPFPTYENGDLFLSWGELGVRAYAADHPDVALRYVRNVIDRYRQDGLAFQRYLRATQQGAGDDILAGNASAITGLYRDIYGIQPRYNRLYLNPHLVKDLYGTRIRYRLRGVEYAIDLNGALNAIAVGGFRVSSAGDFALAAAGDRFLWFAGSSARPALSFGGAGVNRIQVTIREWSGTRRWAEKNPSSVNVVSHEVMDLPANREFEIYCNRRMIGTRTADADGVIQFSNGGDSAGEQLFEVLPK